MTYFTKIQDSKGDEMNVSNEIKILIKNMFTD